MQSRILTLLALYVSYSDGTREQQAADAFLLSHFEKIKALAEWLLLRYTKSLEFPSDHPSHGIPAGDDEADTYIGCKTALDPSMPCWCCLHLLALTLLHHSHSCHSCRA